MNGGKDVKIGHDKRPVSVVPSDEQPLYNIQSGEILTDEYGNPLITEVDQFFLADASKERATSVVFPSDPKDKYKQTKITKVGVSTATYGVDFDVNLAVTNIGFTTEALPVLQVGGGTIGIGTTTPGQVPNVSLANTTTTVNFTPSLNHVEVKLVEPRPIDNGKNSLYFPDEDLSYISGVTVGNKVSGHNIPPGSFVVDKKHNKVVISGDVTSGITTEKVTFFNTTRPTYEADNVLKIQEQFAETSEVSTTLLGVNRAETQLSLFSNVSSYGINDDDWETFTYNTGTSKAAWEQRNNKIYGKRYLARVEEETQESAIKLSVFPAPYSFPFGPNFAKINLYRSADYDQYKDFITLGNDAYNYFSNTSGYSSTFADQFLNPGDAKIVAGDVVYGVAPSQVLNSDKKFDYAFAKIDTWTDTWRSLTKGIYDPVTGSPLTFATLKNILADSGYATKALDGSNTKPGYDTTHTRYSAIQSRRVFRYQPGRISGFTFGLRSSIEPVGGVVLEWGIANETDAYMFKIYGGILSIVRRSTTKLEDSVLKRNGLDPVETPPIQINGKVYQEVQPRIPSGDPFDVEDENGPLNADDLPFAEAARARKYHTIEIPRDNFNGDPLNGNGPSGYTIEPDKVTMWKIEFGWYGAIGARFYAYIPAGAGEARWVVVHTLVIENSLGEPCLRDSYFRFKYSINVSDNRNIRTPQFLYKYGASYYIDGGDEGTSEIYSVSTGLQPKQINPTSETTIFGFRPKDVIYSGTANYTNVFDAVDNKKLMIPTKFNVSSNTLTELKVKTCKGCAGHGHVFTPGVGTTISGREIDIEFAGGNTINIVGSGASFTENDIGAKLIAPSIFNAYITELTDETSYPSGFKSYSSAKIYGWGPGLDGYPNYNTSNRAIAGPLVKDYSTQVGDTGITTAIGIGTAYPHKVRLSNYDVHFASDFPLTGTEIKIQFMNPDNRDGISSYRSNTHFTDIMIGVTDRKPSVTGANTLLGWSNQLVPWKDYGNAPSYNGVGNTSILPESEILFGEHTHSFASLDEDGVETGESWAPSNFRVRMGEDIRIPKITSQSGGQCSTVFVKVNKEENLATDVLQVYLQNATPDPGISTTGNRYFLIKPEGGFSGGITDWKGGQVVYADGDDINGEPAFSSAKFAQNTPTNFEYQGSPAQFIEITDSVKQTNRYDAANGVISDPNGNDSGLIIKGRTVQLRASVIGPPKVKLFTYGVYPLYLVGKLMDNAKINNIVINEESLTFKKATSPKLYFTQNSNGFIDDVSSDATNTNDPPTNFVGIDRLASASVDTQNERKLRDTLTKDIFYVGENQTKEVDMTKVFGVDRNVITPDNNNIEATFITAKQLGSGSGKFIQGSLNFREQ